MALPSLRLLCIQLLPQKPRHSSPVSYCPATSSHASTRVDNRWSSARIVSLYTRASRQQQVVWQQYNQAVEGRDLGKALQILKSIDVVEPKGSRSPFPGDEQPASVPARVQNEEFLLPELSQAELLKVLDACPSSTDLKLVGRTYNFLHMKGVLPNFGRYKNVAADGPRNVTPAVLLELTGLEAFKLSPKKWGLSGSSASLLVALLALFSILVNNNIDVRPMLGIILALAATDAIYLGGTAFAQVLSIWPSYRRCVLVHESGHILVAYLLGCPVRGVILDALQAMQIGIQGQAGTQFWDEDLEEELKQGQLTNASLDRYCMIIFAGIAAEALVYGEAEGGENDENLYKAIISFLRPPWTPSQMSNQARWAVSQCYKLLREHRSAHEAIVTSLEEGSSLGTIVRRIEDSILASFATS